jgi:hypothetical protein
VVQPRADAPSTLFATSAYLNCNVRDRTSRTKLRRNSLAKAKVFHQNGAVADHVRGNGRAAVVILRLPPAGGRCEGAKGQKMRIQRAGAHCSSHVQFNHKFRELDVRAALVERLQLQLHLAAVHVHTAGRPHERDCYAG